MDDKSERALRGAGHDTEEKRLRQRRPCSSTDGEKGIKGGAAATRTAANISSSSKEGRERHPRLRRRDRNRLSCVSPTLQLIASSFFISITDQSPLYTRLERPLHSLRQAKFWTREFPVQVAVGCLALIVGLTLYVREFAIFLSCHLFSLSIAQPSLPWLISLWALSIQPTQDLTSKALRWTPLTTPRHSSC